MFVQLTTRGVGFRICAPLPKPRAARRRSLFLCGPLELDCCHVARCGGGGVDGLALQSKEPRFSGRETHPNAPRCQDATKNRSCGRLLVLLFECAHTYSRTYLRTYSRTHKLSECLCTCGCMQVQREGCIESERERDD